MHRARQHALTRISERRHRLAHEAAKLMVETGIRDFHQAKLKAAGRLGIADDASLPHNREIEAALRDYQRLFLGDALRAGLALRREAALQAMTFLACFDPRLLGAVLEGTADGYSPVALHLHVDDADAVARFFNERGIPAELRSRHVRLDRSRAIDAPVWLFSADGLAFDITVLPADALRQAPLSGMDDRPARRASVAQLRALLAVSETDTTRAHDH